jgi:hypothetical protein
MSVLTPGAESAKWYAVRADDVPQAQALVGEYCDIANANIEFERLLTNTTIKRLKLKRGRGQTVRLVPHLKVRPIRLKGCRYAPMGWLISVQSPDATYRQIYATLANTHEQARLQVFKYCSAINETIRLERLLTDAEVKQIGLQPGEVKLFAT